MDMQGWPGPERKDKDGIGLERIGAAGKGRTGREWLGTARSVKAGADGNG